MTEPSGARLPAGKVTVEVRPRRAGAVRVHDDVVGVDAVALAQGGAQARAPFGLLPPVQHRAQRLAGDGERARIEQPRPAQVQHHFRHAAGQEHLHGGEEVRAVGQRVHQARDLPVHRCPVARTRAPQAGGVGDGGQVQDQVGGAAEGRVHHHRVAQRGVGEDVPHAEAARFERQRRARGAARHVHPDGVAGRRQRRVRQRHAERLAHHLRGGRRAQELAAAAGRGAGAAHDFRGLVRA